MIAVDTNRYSSALSAPSAAATHISHFPLAQAESEQNDVSSPTSHRRPSGFSSRSGFSFSANSGSSNTLLAHPKATSFSSTAAKFKYLSKYRSRRLSQESLTDLFPPTHPDLDLTPQSWGASSLCMDEPLKSSSSFAPSQRSSVIYLGRSSKPSLTRQPSRDKPPLGNMASSKAQVNQSSFALRLRLLSTKATTETQCTQNDKSSIHKYQPEHSSSRSRKPGILKSIPNKFSTTEVLVETSPECDEFEVIKSANRNNFRTVVDSESSDRLSSNINVSSSSRLPLTRELSRSSSSPNLNFTASTFSQRQSQDTDRIQGTDDSLGRPKRFNPPPPIKVPLHAGSSAIAIGSDSSSAVPSRIPRRHFYSSSESIAQSVRRFAGGHWPTSATKQSKMKTSVYQVNETLPQAKFTADSCENLTVTAPSPPNMHIPISNCSASVNKDKFPIMMPLQPAPRRPPGLNLHPNSDNKSRTLPLLISKHSRSLINPTSPSPHRSGFSNTCEGAPPNAPIFTGGVADNPRLSTRLNSAPRISRCPQSPQFVSPTREEASPSPKRLPDAQERQSRPRRSTSSVLIPFPTTDESAYLSPIPDPITSSSNNPKNDLQKNPDHLTPAWSRSSDEDHTASVTSFDIRSFPLRLDSISTPQSVKIPQIQTVPEASLSVFSAKKPITTKIISNSTVSLSVEKTRSSRFNYSSPIRSSVSNGFTDAPRSANPLFTPLSISPSNFSSGALSAVTSKSIECASHFSARGQSMGLSVDDFYVNINSNVLMDFSRRKAKKMFRPRSVSVCEPSRDEFWMRLFRNSQDFTSSSPNTPYSAGYPLPVLTRTYSPRYTAITTRSIDQQIRESTPSELNKIIQDALKAYSSDAHRFIVGDVNQFVQEAKWAEEKTRELHLRYLNAVRKREKFFEEHVIALHTLTPSSGSVLGESLSKLVTQVDQLALELLESIDCSTKISRTCDSHWRAAAAVQLKKLAVKEGHLEAAQSRIEQLEAERCSHIKEISDLQCKLHLLQYQIVPSSGSTDEDSVGSGSIPSTNTPSGPGSPSSTPRISAFTSSGTQRHGKIVQSRMRLSSAHSFGSAYNSNSHLEVGSNDGVHTAPLGEPVSPRTAFLSSYGLAHSHALSLEQSETLSQPMNKNELRSLSPPKIEKPNSSSINTTAGIPFSTLANLHRSDSIGRARRIKPGGLVVRPFFPNNNVAMQKRPINGLHLKGDRTSSLGPSEVRITGPDSTFGASLPPWELKPRSSSAVPVVLPASQSGSRTQQNSAAGYSDLSSIESTSEFQPSSTTHWGASSSSLLRFPRQAPPPPALPLPSEQAMRRRGDWSPEGPGNGNLSSITLSQLGSMDIANLINNLDSSHQRRI